MTRGQLPIPPQKKSSLGGVCIGTYTDQEYDTATGLYNYNARLYDPAVGIFVSPDSIVPDWYDPQLLNKYAYVRNNPLKYTDPDGHFLVSAAIVVGGVIAAKVVGLAVGYLGVKAAEKVATIKADSATKQSASKSINSALESTAKTSGASTATALGAAGLAVAIGKGYAVTAALTPEKVAIGAMSAAQRPEIAKTIDTIKNLPETVQGLPDKAKKAAEKTLELTQDLMGQIGPESEAQGQNEADVDTTDGQSDNNPGDDPDTE